MRISMQWRRWPGQRQGYTLIELLITMALIMLIMAILSTSFIVGLDTFGKMKALGDIAERLRGAVNVLRRDLSSDHFEGGLRVSDPAVFTNPYDAATRPREGFFRVREFAGSTQEGRLTPEGVESTRAFRDVLHMTVKLRGNQPDDFFSAPVPPNSPLLSTATTFFDQPVDARHQRDPKELKPGERGAYRTQWAEVIYYLVPLEPGTITAASWTANGTPLYALNRQVRLAVVDNRKINYDGDILGFSGVSFNKDPASWKTFSPRDMTDPTKRYWKLANSTDENSLLKGLASPVNMLLTDVVSFDIKLLRSPNLPLPPTETNAPNRQYGFPLGFANFEDPSVWPGLGAVGGWDSGHNSATFPIMAIQITLRVWDLKTQQTRQITMIQDL